MQRKDDMPEPRLSFAICALNNFIYTGGGYTKMDGERFSHSNITTDRVDRFDVLKNSWEVLL